MPKIPQIKFTTDVVSSTDTSSGNIILIAGHVLDPAEIKAGYELYTPIKLGQVTTLDYALALCDNIGLQYSFNGYRAIDLTTTDPIAVTFLSAVMEFEAFKGSSEFEDLDPCVFVLGLLEDGVDTKVVSPYGTLLDSLDANQQDFDLFVSPYPYALGDKDIADNYFNQIKTYIAPKQAQPDPTKGEYFAFFANTTSDVTNIANFEETYFEYSINMCYPIGADNLGKVLGVQSVHLVGMVEPFEGRADINFATMPAPTTITGQINDDIEQNLVNIGWNSIRVDPRSFKVRQSNIVVADFNDYLSGLPRDFFYLYQDYKIAARWRTEMFIKVKDAGILNTRFTFRKDGSSPLFVRVKELMVELSQDFFVRRLFGFSPEVYYDDIIVRADKDDLNVIRLAQPLYVSSVVIAILGRGSITNSNTIIQALTLNLE